MYRRWSTAVAASWQVLHLAALLMASEAASSHQQSHGSFPTPWALGPLRTRPTRDQPATRALLHSYHTCWL